VTSRQRAVTSRPSIATVVVWAVLLCASPVSAALTEAPRLAAVYGSILAAQFDRVDAQLAQTCPPAPAEACASLGVVSLWWQIQMTPESTVLDDRFNALAAKAVAASEQWTKREPNRGEAWFYLAGAYAPLVQWRVLRGERIAAARDGKKIKDALERALQLDPSLDDAFFGIGLYHYYADVAPTAAKILRWLLLLPGGDRVKGLQEMLQARQRGVLLKGEADYQLQLIYLWYEQQPARALELLRELDARYPTNPLFIQRIAEVEDEYLHDRSASAVAWQLLLERARAGRVADAARRTIRARLALAAQLDVMYETDRAIEQLNAVLEADPSVRSRADLARAQWQLGVAYDRLGRRDLAVPLYTAALNAPDIDAASRARIREALRRTPDAQASEAYRLSLEGWRAFERGALDGAATALTRAIDLDPLDQVAHYRLARVLVARGEHARAKDQLEHLIGSRVAPAFVLAAAYVAYAQLLERDGDRTRAIENYRAAANLVGGAASARDDARAALMRLRAA
jgi:tetratricopeptide (TPR) repeat protein